MLRLPVSRIIDLVRRNMDEIEGHETQMAGADYDDKQGISVIVTKCIPEAIRQVHLSADLSLLEGKEAKTEDYTVEGDEISMDVPVLRLVSFKAKESPFVVNEAFSEGSPIGRMQQDRYVKGTYDAPVLIQKSLNNGPGKPVYVYHSFKDENDAVESISYIPEPMPDETYYEISPKLQDALIEALSAKVMSIIYGKQA